MAPGSTHKGLAEGARRVLLIAPKPLLGQWGQELFQLFDIQAREGQARLGGFDGEGVFLVEREAAGSEKGREALLAAEAFDLCVIDEAHEIFAGIYKRFDKFGQYQHDAPHARTAGRVREVLLASRMPVLLLTATPIHEDFEIREEPSSLELPDADARSLEGPGALNEAFDPQELRSHRFRSGRPRDVVVEGPLRGAHRVLKEPGFSADERLLEKVLGLSAQGPLRYLLEPGILAFHGSHRQLLLLGFHRRMASSTRALAASLERVAARLRRMLAGDDIETTGAEELRGVVADLEGGDAAHVNRVRPH